MSCFKLFILSVFIAINRSSGEIFTAMDDVENLKILGRNISSIINEYLQMEEERLHKLRELASINEKLCTERLEPLNDAVLVSPTNAYMVIKFLAQIWTPLMQLMKSNSADEFFNHLSNSEKILNIEEDVKGAEQALIRLQSMYQLPIKDLASGNLVGTVKAIPLRAIDCFDVGKSAFAANDYPTAVLWLEEAYERYQQELPFPTVSALEILEYLAYTTGETGDYDKALMLTDKLLNIDPNHTRALQNQDYYRTKVNSWQPVPDRIEISIKNDNGDRDRYKYDALCRGDIQRSEFEQSKLYCYYKSDKPFLKIAPIKVELLHLKPNVLLFRDIISEEEVEIMKHMASPKLHRSLVFHSASQKSESRNRISKNAWLDNNAHEIIPRLNNRVSDMTNLDAWAGEEFQVANYGLGGFYDLHIDMVFVDGHGMVDTERMIKEDVRGDRIATVLFYLSQPTAGGATAFPLLDLTVFPTYRDAVVWYNYDENGRPDMNMYHAGCPVLTGSKWIANKWIHQHGQEFQRPCTLNEYSYYDSV